MTTATAFDEAKAESFGGDMINLLNNAFLALQISIGHQTGLFDVMSELAPSTSAEIAEAAGLNERYVREWLSALVLGHIIDYDPPDKTYTFPPEHAASLTRAAGSNNLAAFTQYLALLGTVEQDIVTCFRIGGGVPYSAYPRFQKLQAEESATIQDAGLVKTVLPFVPGLVARLENGTDVLEVGCGYGHATNLMAKAFPNSRFTGFDISQEGIATGKAEAQRLGLTNAHFEVKDVTTLEAQRQYGLIVAFDVIHDLAKPAYVLHAIHDALRPGGVFLMVDIAASSHFHENIEHPLAPAIYTFSLMHCLTVSLSQNGDGLGAMWGEQKAREMLDEAGFAQVEVKRNPDDPFNNYYIALKS